MERNVADAVPEFDFVWFVNKNNYLGLFCRVFNGVTLSNYYEMSCYCDIMLIGL